MTQKEIGRIQLTDTQTLVVSIVDKDRLDLRIWVDGDKYKGPTKKGFRFNLYDGNWDRLKEIMNKVDGFIE